MAKAKTIINPSALTPADNEFINANNQAPVQATPAKSKNHNISMKPEIWDTITKFLADNPSEGSASGLIARAVMEYIKRK